MLDLFRSLPGGMVFFIVVLFTQAPMCFANAEPPLSREALATELEDIERLTDLLPFEKQNPDFLKQRLLEDNYRLTSDRRSLFGLEEVSFEKRGQHKTIYLNFSFFNNAYLGEYLVNVISYRDDDLGLKLRAVWLQNGGVVSTQNEEEIQVNIKYADERDRYDQQVANGYGALLPVQVPDHLMTGYEYLVSDMYDETVGQSCLIEVPGLWFGQCAIDQLVAADRIDLLENVLNGFNPGARILAARELTRLGVATRPDIQKTINKLVQLNTPIHVSNSRNVVRIKSPQDIRELIKSGDGEAIINRYVARLAR